MPLTVDFRSPSTFFASVLHAISKHTLAPGDTLTVKIAQAGNFLDLYSLGRVLAFVDLLQRQQNVTIAIDLEHVRPARIRKLQDLNFFHYCQTRGILCPTPRPRQLNLISNEPVPSKPYWYVLVPLTAIELDNTRHEAQALSQTNQVLRCVASVLQENLASHLPNSCDDLQLEVDHLLFGILRELILNTIIHSTAKGFLLAMTLDSSGRTDVRAHRPGVVFEAGQEKFDLLVMDLGRGIFPSAQEELGMSPTPSDRDYSSLAVWRPAFAETKRKEESLLTTIFRGNLLIRKGRKSEGLHELARHVGWFNGFATLRTGRTEVLLRSSADRDSTPDIRVKDHYFLPGVITSALLPSHQVRTLLTRLKVTSPVHQGTTDGQPRRPVLVRPFRWVPKALFGAETNVELRRKIELHARRLQEDYRAWASEHKDAACFCELDLRLSRGIGTPFLDSLIQELCKDYTRSGGAGIPLLSRMFITNARRELIQSLKRCICTSFLMITNTVCLVCDETDQPHFLQLPRITDNLYDMADFLLAIFYAGSLPESVLRTEWGAGEEQLLCLRKTIGTDEANLFYRTGDGDDVVYWAHDVLNAMCSRRNSRIKAFGKRIGRDVRFFGDMSESRPGLASRERQHRANAAICFDVAKEFIRTGQVPPVSTLVGFMGNGDRLAAILQRILGAPRLIYVDPTSPDSWAHAGIEADFVLVVELVDNAAEAQIAPFIQRIACCGGGAKGVEARCVLVLGAADVRPPERSGGAGAAVAGCPVLSAVKVVSELEPASGECHAPSLPEGAGATTNRAGLDGTATAQPAPPRNGWPLPRSGYSDVELSAEFWHNACALGIVSARRTGRERRNILFYENNERILENPRTRAVLEQQLSVFIRDTLQLEVDVVLHPEHPMGAFLAQHVCSHLPRLPLVLPIPQPEYGGAIQVATREFAAMREAVEEHRKKAERSVLRALVLDDSIITGRSIFAMLGLADTLGLRPAGVFVVLNRLPTEVSAAISSLPCKFAYLYRLHMPILSDAESPDGRTSSLANWIGATVNSFFARSWSESLCSCTSYFLTGESLIDGEEPLRVLQRTTYDEEPLRLPMHELRQILDGLILHHDSVILDFWTRLAVAYNFLDPLLSENAFWNVLLGLLETSLSEKRETNEAHFVRKLIYLIAFSPHISQQSVLDRFRGFCTAAAERCLHEGDAFAFVNVLSDCLMALGVVASESVLAIGSQVLSTLGPCALGERGNADQGQGPKKRDDARRVLGAYAWSLGAFRRSSAMPLAPRLTDYVANALRDAAGPSEQELLLLDVYRAFLNDDRVPRERLGIQAWLEQDRFIEELTADERRNPLVRYLAGAPGYTFTLKSVLFLTRAHTILLFSRNQSDEHLFLQAYDTRDRLAPGAPLSRADLSDEFLSPQLQERMRDGLFFFRCTPQQDVCALNRFAAKTEHDWILGAPVRHDGVAERYYVVLGYCGQPSDSTFLRTSYEYWLRAEDLLRHILPAIHERHIASSTAWHALVQAVKPIHHLRGGRATRGGVLAAANARMDLGALLRQAVGLSRQAAITSEELLERIRAAENSFRTRIRDVCADDPGLQVVIPTDGNWPVAVVTQRFDLPRDVGHFALHAAVFDFVLHECLCNSLDGFRSYVRILLDVRPTERRHDERDLAVVLTIENDVMANAATGQGSGIAACETAANAVGGTFQSRGANSGWRAVLTLPVYRVPHALTRWLYELLR